VTGWTAVTRSALGFAALGAGLIHVALAIGATPWLAAGLVVAGAAEFLWGVLAVSRPGLPVPRAAIVGALVAPIGWLALLAAGIPDGPRPLPMLAATALGAAVAVGLARGLRRPAVRESRHPALGIAAAGLVVAAITIPALVATEAPALLPGPVDPVHQAPQHPGP